MNEISTKILILTSKLILSENTFSFFDFLFDAFLLFSLCALSSLCDLFYFYLFYLDTGRDFCFYWGFYFHFYSGFFGFVFSFSPCFFHGFGFGCDCGFGFFHGVHESYFSQSFRPFLQLISSHRLVSQKLEFQFLFQSVFSRIVRR